MAESVDLQALSRFNNVAEDTVFEGTIRVDGDVRINGRVIGTVTAGRVVVAANGVIEGDVHAASADVAGHLEGEAAVSDCLVLRSSAHVEGIIRSGRLVIEEGAVFNGTCRTGAEAAVRAPSPVVLPEEGPPGGAVHRPLGALAPRVVPPSVPRPEAEPPDVPPEHVA